MGKKKILLSTQLTPAENQQLQAMIKEYSVDLKQKIEEKYPDDYNRTIMMEDSITKSKNEILRKIKYFKAKKTSMPDFIRKTRQEIMTMRENHDYDDIKKEMIETSKSRLNKKNILAQADINSVTTSNNGPSGSIS